MSKNYFSACSLISIYSGLVPANIQLVILIDIILCPLRSDCWVFLRSWRHTLLHFVFSSCEVDVIFRSGSKLLGAGIMVEWWWGTTEPGRSQGM